MVKCPKCEKKGEEKDFECAIRQGMTIMHGIEQNVIDMGFECPCGEEFGFMHFIGRNWERLLLEEGEIGTERN